MAMTREYLELVESGIDIAPVGSQEEVQAAEYMLDAFEEHGLETELQDLTAPLYSRVVIGLALVLMMLAAIFSGLGGFGWAIGGFLTAFFLGAFLMTDYLGMNPLSDVGPRAESQNVIGIHRGEGPRSGRGVRPVVVLCRYDTGREELFANPAIANLSPLIKSITPWCVVIVVIGTVLQLFQFMAGPALIVLWIITMVAALPLAALGVNEVTAPFLNLTDGANDNKASLGALLGVLEDVVPTDEGRLRVRAAQLAEATAANRGVEPGEDGLFYEEYEDYEEVPVIGVRHGRQVLESIGMLPPTCEIEYEKPGRQLVIKRRAVELPSPAAVPDISEQPTEEEDVVVETVGDEAFDDEAFDDESFGDTDSRRFIVVGEAKPRPELTASGDTEPIEIIGEEVEAEEVPSLESMTESQIEQVESAGVSGWGASDFEPGRPRSRRSLLFDLPDPNVDAQDPLSADLEMESAEDADDQPTEFVSAAEIEARAEVLEEESGHRGRRHRLGHGGSRGGEPKKSLRDRLHFGRRKKQEESFSDWLDVDEDFDARTEGEEIGSWENFESYDGDEDDWRGGATRSSNARARLERIRAMADEVEGDIESHGLIDGSVEDIGAIDEVYDDGGEETDVYAVVNADAIPVDAPDEVAEEAALASLDANPTREGEVVPDVDVIGPPDDEELADAVLEMGDVNLVAHDIWFVCVGASALGHAGTKAFVSAHRRELRGCFIVNLDSVGAGDLTALTSEGFGDTRKGDRKIQRLLDMASKVVHVPVMLATHDWEDTDATPALRRSMRGLTLMGTVGGKQRALANTAEDIAENLNPNQVVYVSQLVSEIIRRA